MEWNGVSEHQSITHGSPYLERRKTSNRKGTPLSVDKIMYDQRIVYTKDKFNNRLLASFKFFYII